MMRNFKCIRMEDFTAVDKTPIEHCRYEVKNSDIFIGIIGHNYGSIPDGYSKSFTEIEWDEAVKNKIPKLMFLAPSDFKTPMSIRESDEKYEKQKKFRNTISKFRVRVSFDDPKDLATEVLLALHNKLVEDQLKNPDDKKPSIVYDDYLIFIEYFNLYEHKKETVWDAPWVFETFAAPVLIKQITFFKQSTLTPIKFNFTNGLMPEKASVKYDPVFRKCEDGGMALLLERTSTNQLKNSAKPETQYCHFIHPGKNVLWVKGNGLAKMTVENIIFEAIEDKPCIFEITKENTFVKVEVIGNLKKFQLEPGEIPTRFIKTEADYIISRPGDTLMIDVPSSVTIL